MKKIIFATILSMGLTSVSHAALSANLLIKGTVPRLLEISVSSLAIATTLPLDSTQTDTKIATVNEKSNSKTGYNVSISSAKLGKLVHETETSSSINYALKYNGNSVDLVAGQTFTYSSAVAANNNRDIEISYTGVAHDLLVEGDYTDTVTFAISAN